MQGLGTRSISLSLFSLSLSRDVYIRSSVHTCLYENDICIREWLYVPLQPGDMSTVCTTAGSLERPQAQNTQNGSRTSVLASM